MLTIQDANIALLHDELEAAGLTSVQVIESLGGGFTVRFDGDNATAQSVLDAHNPSELSFNEQAVLDAEAARDALLDAKAQEAMNELNASITALSAEVSDLNGVITALDGVSPTQLTALTDITTLASSLDTVTKTLRLVLFALSGREGEGAGSLRWQRREIDYINKTR